MDTVITSALLTNGRAVRTQSDGCLTPPPFVTPLPDLDLDGKDVKLDNSSVSL